MDWTNIIGIVIQTLAIMATGAAFLFRLHVDLRLWIQQAQATASRVAQIEIKMEKISDLITAIAIQDARLNAVDVRLNELSIRLNSHIKEEA